MPSENARNVVRKVKDDPRLSHASLAGPISELRQAVRDATLAATEVQLDLQDVHDPDGRRQGIEELNQKVSGFLERARRMNEWIAKLESTAKEIDRELPRIVEQLGVELG